MRVLAQFVLNVRRAETPFYQRLKRFATGVLTAQLPLTGPLKLLYRALDAAVEFTKHLLLRFWVFFYRSPLFRSRCAEVGKRLRLDRVPYVSGNVKIRIGNDVKLSGQIDILAGQVHNEPEVVVGDNVFLGHQVALRVAERIVIEEGALVAGRVLITDNDAHPLDIAARYRAEPPEPDGVKPVRIGRCAWLGTGCYVLKGVTVGDGAVVAAGSVVVNDVPPFSIAAGVPAKVVKTLEPPPEGLEALLVRFRRRN